MKVFKGSGLYVNLALGALLVGGIYGAIIYRQNIYDWWTLQTYLPPANIVALADQTAMEGSGRTDFYVSKPEVESSDAFNMHCSDFGEKSVVLGCYTGQKIYIYNVTDPRLNGIVAVTAAHEMLHAAYARLSTDEKQQVDAMIEAELPNVTDERLKGLIELYATSEPGEKLNEMHSILGTEYSALSPQLETYYKKYFSDRSKVVALAAAYEANFTQSQAKIVQFNAQLESLKSQIDVNSAALEAQKVAIESESQALNVLRSTNTSEYNAAVPGYNQKVNQYNALVVQTRSMIDQYNQLVVEHNNEATAQNSLYQSLNSHYQTVN